MAAGDISNDQARSTLEQILGSSEFTQSPFWQNLQESCRSAWQNLQEFFRPAEFPKEQVAGDHWDIAKEGVMWLRDLILLAIVLAGVILVIWLIWKVAPFRRSMAEEARKEEELAQLHVRPAPDKLAREAEKKALRGDFRGALRDVYLSVLLEMDNRRLIAFKAAKTNSEYVGEITKKAAGLTEPFRSLVNLFEYKWYGLEDCSNEDFQRGRELYAVLLKDDAYG